MTGQWSHSPPPLLLRSAPFSTNDNNDDNNDNDDDNHNDNNDNAPQVLVNEALVSYLRRTGVNKVRLVLEGSPKVVTLLEAIRISADKGLDMVGVDLHQEIKVIKAMDWKLAQYRDDKLRQGEKKKKRRDKEEDAKEIQFRAAIASGDFQRKVKNILSWLRKGYACQVTVSHNTGDPEAVEQAVQLMERIHERVKHVAILPRALPLPTERLQFVLKPKN